MPELRLSCPRHHHYLGLDGIRPPSLICALVLLVLPSAFEHRTCQQCGCVFGFCLSSTSAFKMSGCSTSESTCIGSRSAWPCVPHRPLHPQPALLCQAHERQPRRDLCKFGICISHGQHLSVCCFGTEDRHPAHRTCLSKFSQVPRLQMSLLQWLVSVQIHKGKCRMKQTCCRHLLQLCVRCLPELLTAKGRIHARLSRRQVHSTESTAGLCQRYPYTENG